MVGPEDTPDVDHSDLPKPHAKDMSLNFLA